MSIGLDDFIPLMQVIAAKRFIQDEKEHFFEQHVRGAESRIIRRKRELIHQARQRHEQNEAIREERKAQAKAKGPRIDLTPPCPPGCSTEAFQEMLRTREPMDGHTTIEMEMNNLVVHEYNSNCLAEPEVIHFVAQFEDLFKAMFNSYFDYPVRDLELDDIENEEGHMTFSAFMRFCQDFRFFPRLLSYEDIHFIYENSRCAMVRKCTKRPSERAKQLKRERKLNQRRQSLGGDSMGG